MFGTYRILLALLVAAYHLARDSYAGPPAVFAFFVLSGYLMTLIVNGAYAGGLGGIGRYLLNRILRIYPAYYVALALGIVIVWLAPEAALRYSSALRWPGDLFDRIAQFTIVGQNFGPRVVVTAWSVGYELIFYACIGFIGRSRLLCFVWFVLSAQIVVALFVTAPATLAVAGAPPVASLAFASGAMVHHYGHRLAWIGAREGIAAAALLMLFCYFCDLASETWYRQYAATIAAAIATVATAGLRHLRPMPVGAGRIAFGRVDFGRLDRVLGDLSYPFFLLHHLVGLVVSILTGLTRDWPLFLVAASLSLLLSWGTRRYVEMPVEALRSALRPRAKARPDAGLEPQRLASAQNAT